MTMTADNMNNKRTQFINNLPYAQMQIRTGSIQNYKILIESRSSKNYWKNHI